MNHIDFERIISEMEMASNNKNELLMGHMLILIPILEQLNLLIEETSDFELRKSTEELREIIPDLLNRMAQLMSN